MSPRRFNQDAGYIFRNDFVGTTIGNTGSNPHPWWSARGGAGSLALVDGGLLQISASANDWYELYRFDLCDFSVAAHADLTARWRIDSLSSILTRIGLKSDPSISVDWICVLYDPTINGNWHAQCSIAGASSTVDTGLAADLNYHEFQIECDPVEVRFSIDSVLKASISVNVSSQLLQPYVYVESKTGSSRDTFLDCIEVFGERDV